MPGLNEKWLTIYIPTFNRPNQLRNLLEKLSKLTNIDKCDVVISDNHSKSKIEDVDKYIRFGFYYIYNMVNIGSGANILRAFEIAKTEYLWILGDDDLPNDDAIEIIINDITKKYDIINYEFNDSGQRRVRSKSIEGKDSSGFIRDMDHLAASLFISSNIYRVKKFIPYISEGYSAIFSGMPHLTVTINALKETGSSYLYSDKQIVRNGWDSTPEELRWNFSQVVPRMPSVLQVLKINKVERSIFKKLMFECFKTEDFIINILGSRKYSDNEKKFRLNQYRNDYFEMLSYRQIIKLFALEFMPFFYNSQISKISKSLKTEGRLD